MNVTEDVLTIGQIETQYKSEWVLIENPQTDNDLNIYGGKVIEHSKNRDEIYRKAVALRPKRCAILYTGEIPDDTAVVL